MKRLLISLAVVCLLFLFGAVCILFGARMARQGAALADNSEVQMETPKEPPILPLAEPRVEPEPAPVIEVMAVPERASDEAGEWWGDLGGIEQAGPLELRAEIPPVSPKSVPKNPVPPPKAAPPVRDLSPQVFVGGGSSEFHRAGCGHLKQGSFATTLNKAQTAGYTPCTVCDPLALKEPSVLPPGTGTSHEVFVPKNPRGEKESMEMLLRAMDQAPNAYRVAISWIDPFTDLKRHLEYRRDTQTVLRWDAKLWEQWTGVPEDGIYSVSQGDTLDNWGFHLFYPVHPELTLELGGHR